MIMDNDTKCIPKVLINNTEKQTYFSKFYIKFSLFQFRDTGMGNLSGKSENTTLFSEEFELSFALKNFNKVSREKFRNFFSSIEV